MDTRGHPVAIPWTVSTRHETPAKQPGVPGALDDTERALYYRLVQGISQLADDPRWKAIMKDAKIAKDAADKALRDLLASLPPEVRLAGLDPEARLAGLDPEVRLAGLDPEEVLAHYKPQELLAHFKPQERLAGLDAGEVLLALPDEALRALPDSYLATLPEPVRARIRARIAR